MGKGNQVKGGKVSRKIQPKKIQPKKSQAKKTNTKRIQNQHAQIKKNQIKKIVNDSKPEVVEDEDDNIDVDEEDLEYFKNNSAFSGFLTTMDASSLSNIIPKKRKISKVSMTDTAESKPRRNTTWNDDSHLQEKLPIKSFDGSLLKNERFSHSNLEEQIEEDTINNEDEEERNSSSSEEEEEEEMEFEEILEDKSNLIKQTNGLNKDIDLKKLKLVRANQKKQDMAFICESILENPELAFKRNKEKEDGKSKFIQLHDLCEDGDKEIVSLAMLSELTIFLDIIPGYRLRLPTAEELKVKVKKEVKQVRDYEAALLLNYQKFLKFLDEKASSQDEYTIGIAVRCMSELLKHKYHFNYTKNLILALVPHANSSSMNIRSKACEAFVHVFNSDISGLTSLEITKQISRYVKLHKSCVNCSLMDVFLQLPLQVNMKRGEEARRKVKSDRKKHKKSLKEGDTIKEGLQEAEAVLNNNEIEKTQTDILHELVLIYFRILKTSVLSSALPSVLKGLSKFAFLINIDIIMDLIKVLKTLLKTETLPIDSSLHAILTALKTLKGPGQELHIDEKEFVDMLYKILLEFLTNSNQKYFPLALSCLEEIFFYRRELVIERVAAFVRRLLMISAYLQSHHILGILSFLRCLFHKYSKLQQLIENDQDKITSGIYRADLDNPDFCNPFASSCWELSLLKFHFNPIVASFAQGTACMEPSLPTESPHLMMSNHDVSKMEFISKMIQPKIHPYSIQPKGLKKREYYVGKSSVSSDFFKEFSSSSSSSLNSKVNFKLFFNAAIAAGYPKLKRLRKLERKWNEYKCQKISNSN